MAETMIIKPAYYYSYRYSLEQAVYDVKDFA